MDDMFKLMALVVAKVLLWLLDCLLDLVLGYTVTGGTREERRRAWMDHEHSAHLVRVVARGRRVEMQQFNLTNFLYVHEKYVSPRYILEHENVTLFSMDAKNAIFCVSEPEVDVYDMRRYTFLFLSHYFDSKRLIILPLASFNRLGDELGDPKVPVCLVGMTARCGSTLISQIVSRVPHVRSMSEPQAMLALNSLFRRRHFNWDATRKLIQTCVRLQCKVEPGSGVERFVLKMTPPTSPMFLAISEMFPDIDLIFNTRHPKPSINSTIKVKNSMAKKSLYLRLNISIVNLIHTMVPLPYTERHLKPLESLYALLRKYSMDDLLALIWGGVLVNYLEHRSIYKHVVLYENLTASPEAEVKKLFGILNISQEHVPGALEALKQDSQKGSLVGRQERFELDNEQWGRVDRVLAEMGVGVSCNMSVDEFKKFFEK